MAEIKSVKSRLADFYTRFSSNQGLYRPVQNYYFDIDISFTTRPSKISNNILNKYVEAFRYLVTEVDIPNFGLHVGTVSNIIIITPVGRWVSPGNSSILSNDPFSLTFLDTDLSIIENFFYPWMEENSLTENQQTFKPFVRADIYVSPLMTDASTERCTYKIHGAYPVVLGTPTLSQTANGNFTRRIEFDYNNVTLETKDSGIDNIYHKYIYDDRYEEVIDSNGDTVMQERKSQAFQSKAPGGTNGNMQQDPEYAMKKAGANFDIAARANNTTDSESNGDLNAITKLDRTKTILGQANNFISSTSQSNGNLSKARTKQLKEQQEQQARQQQAAQKIEQQKMAENKMFGQTAEQAVQARGTAETRLQQEYSERMNNNSMTANGASTGQYRDSRISMDQMAERQVNPKNTSERPGPFITPPINNLNSEVNSEPKVKIKFFV